MRVGEASRPGPPAARLRTRRAGGAEATLSCSSATGGAFAWQFTTAPRCGGPRRATPKEALDAWLGRNRDKLEEAAAAELGNWNPDAEATQPYETQAAQEQGKEPDDQDAYPVSYTHLTMPTICSV